MGKASAIGTPHMDIELRAASSADLPILTQMNKRLIEDEHSRNPMQLDALQARMAGWLQGDWFIDLIVVDGGVIGYAVFRLREDEYTPEATEVYLRQFYIERTWRDQGIGTAAFRQLCADRFPEGSTVVVDVLEANPRGRRFWEKVGFRPYCTTLRRGPGT